MMIDDFFDMVENRFDAAYLQKFGIFVIDVEKGDGDATVKTMNEMGIQTIKIPDKQGSGADSADKEKDRYLKFCSALLGYDAKCTDFRKFLEEYSKILSRTKDDYSIFVREGGENREDHEHGQYPYKVAVFEYLVKELMRSEGKTDLRTKEVMKYIVDNKILVKKDRDSNKSTIFSEKKDGDIIPDLIWENAKIEDNGKWKNIGKLFIEFETLMGTLEPMKKVDKTVEKYLDGTVEKPERLWLVFRPVSALIHMEELRTREKMYRDMYDLNIEMFVLVRERDEWNLLKLNRFRRKYGM